MGRAVIPLVRAGGPVVDKFVADRLPGFAAVIGTLHQLSEPAGGLRRIDAIRIGGRTLHVINFPAAEKRPADIPSLALSIGGQNESALVRAHQDTDFAHRDLLSPTACVENVTYGKTSGIWES